MYSELCYTVAHIRLDSRFNSLPQHIGCVSKNLMLYKNAHWTKLIFEKWSSLLILQWQLSLDWNKVKNWSILKWIIFSFWIYFKNVFILVKFCTSGFCWRTLYMHGMPPVLYVIRHEHIEQSLSEPFGKSCLQGRHPNRLRIVVTHGKTFLTSQFSIWLAARRPEGFDQVLGLSQAHSFTQWRLKNKGEGDILCQAYAFLYMGVF